MVLTESLAICEYFEELYPEKRQLLPKDLAGKFFVRRLCETINAGTQPIHNLAILNEIGTKFGEEHKAPWAKWANERGLRAFEKHV